MKLVISGEIFVGLLASGSASGNTHGDSKCPKLGGGFKYSLI